MNGGKNNIYDNWGNGITKIYYIQAIDFCRKIASSKAFLFRNFLANFILFMFVPSGTCEK